MGAGLSGRLPLGVSVSPRAHAAQILGRVVRGGAYSNVLLGTLGGSADDRLVRRLVYGTLRQLLAVDAVLAEASDRPLDDIEPAVLDVLRIATWELRFGGGAPHASVNEAVEAAIGLMGRRVSGFVNGVLRAVQSSTPLELPQWLELGAPEWVLDRLTAAWGRAEAVEFLEASLRPAPRTARLRPGAAGGRPVPGIPGAVEVDTLSEGMVVMDPASVAVGLAGRLEAGTSVLDMAAAPGGKTLHLFDQLGPTGQLVASDRHERRVTSARRRLGRQGADVPWIVADGVELPFGDATFDRVLLDAPCTGLGTLRRRPEIRQRVKPRDPGHAGALQHRLLQEARRVTNGGGLVVYAVCTVFAEETTDVVADLPARPPEGLPGRTHGNGLLLGPHLTGTDGMFISIVDA